MNKLYYRIPRNLSYDFLQASWIIEEATCKPGSNWLLCQKISPVWGSYDKSSEIVEETLEFLEDNKDCYNTNPWDDYEYYDCDWTEMDYYELTNGRNFNLDIETYVVAQKYAEYVKEISRNYDEPNDKMESFFEFSSALKNDNSRVMIALAIAAGTDNFDAYVSLEGSKVKLTPAKDYPQAEADPSVFILNEVKKWTE